MYDSDATFVRGKDVPTFANFSFSEWVAALTHAWGPEGAEQFVKGLFDAIGSSPSNGYSLPMAHWALLSRLGPDAEARVEAMTRDFPETCLAEIAALRRAWDLEASD